MHKIKNNARNAKSDYFTKIVATCADQLIASTEILTTQKSVVTGVWPRLDKTYISNHCGRFLGGVDYDSNRLECTDGSFIYDFK